MEDRAAAAKKQLQAIVDQYPHTHTADIARYLLGTTAIEVGDNTTAEKQLKDVASNGNRDVASLAKLALASLYGNLNRTKDALDLYKQLIDKPSDTVGKVTAQLQLAQLYESSQQPAEAKKIYEQIVKENQPARGVFILGLRDSVVVASDVKNPPFTLPFSKTNVTIHRAGRAAAEPASGSRLRESHSPCQPERLSVRAWNARTELRSPSRPSCPASVG
jgi:tetratricopeptide (TPR) repeat protein